MPKLTQKSTIELKKKKMDLAVQTLKDNYGNITLTCDKVGIDRKTFYNWIEKENYFKEQVEDLNFEERNLDLAENQLRKLMVKGNVTAIIFYLKTKGRARGYIERPDNEIQLNINNTISRAKELWEKYGEDIVIDAEMVRPRQIKGD